MKAVELDKVFNPADFEDRIYKYWMDNDLFSPKESDDPEKNENPFTIVIPPPNVTGVLHMGHGLNNTLQDILIRYHRMTGRPTLWLPGTDHAGIATQNIVEKQLKAKGISRLELGREKFVEETLIGTAYDLKKFISKDNNIKDRDFAFGLLFDLLNAQYSTVRITTAKVIAELVKKYRISADCEKSLITNES